MVPQTLNMCVCAGAVGALSVPAAHHALRRVHAYHHPHSLVASHLAARPAIVATVPCVPTGAVPLTAARDTGAGIPGLASATPVPVSSPVAVGGGGFLPGLGGGFPGGGFPGGGFPGGGFPGGSVPPIAIAPAPVPQPGPETPPAPVPPRPAPGPMPVPMPLPVPMPVPSPHPVPTPIPTPAPATTGLLGLGVAVMLAERARRARRGRAGAIDGD